MPPLEKRQPHVLALAEPSLHRRIASDPAGEADDPIAAYTAAKASRRQRLRLRRTGKPSAESPEAVSIAPAAGRPQFASRSPDIVLSTRNPVIVWLANNELPLSLGILAVVYLCSWAGFAWPARWLSVQHAAADGRYVRGAHDAKFVALWICRIIAARAVMLHHILPAIPRYYGITRPRTLRRFGESTWFLCYITLSWSIGFHIWRNSPYYMNTRNLYTNYPEDHCLMPYTLKWYYLVQAAFWISNLYTVFVEERRKDHYEMVTHHCATIALVLLSYTFHFTRFGHVFMLVMDFPDLFLTSAKMLRYLGSEMAPNVLFAVFTVSWVATKHYLCLKLMFSIWTQGLVEVPLEKRYPNHPDSYASYTIVGGMWALLCVLQVVLIYWLVLIIKLLKRVLLTGEEPQDSRSDDEGDEEEEEEAEKPQTA